MAPHPLVRSDQQLTLSHGVADTQVVAATRKQQAQGETKLAQQRVKAGVTQEELARVVGISRTSLIRLETGRSRNPLLGWYVNCAIALGVKLDDVLDDDVETKWHWYDQLRPPTLNWIERAKARRPHLADLDPNVPRSSPSP
jgi:DNA-binding XRE family transcriptional regulator